MIQVQQMLGIKLEDRKTNASDILIRIAKHVVQKMAEKNISIDQGITKYVKEMLKHVKTSYHIRSCASINWRTVNTDKNGWEDIEKAFVQE